MGIFDGILLVSDLDGTLLCKSDSKISDGNVKAIKYFMSEGGRFGFATGRLVSELGPFEKEIKTNTYSICGNGTMLCRPGTGETLSIETCGDELLPFLDKIISDFPDIMPEIDSYDTIFYTRSNEIIEKHKEITEAPFKKIEQFSDAEKPWYKIALWGTEGALDDLLARFPSDEVPKQYKLLKTYKFCAELVSCTANKGTALYEYKKLFPDIVSVMAVGDNSNDLEMIKLADIGFAVSNAIEEVKACADVLLTNDCDHDAVAEAIEYIRQNKIK